ncbi:MAG: transposase family protein, partial [Chromatiales bacterium]
MGGRNQQWQADLVDVASLKKHNDGTTFLLTVIDVFSKVARCIPLKNKSAVSLVRGFHELFEGDDRPLTLQTDKGLEFLNRGLQGLEKVRHTSLIHA